jgi:hypothetical protein
MNVFDVAFANDLQFKNGDFEQKESTAQHIEHILIAAKGEYKYAPFTGANIRIALSDEGAFLALQGNIQEALEQDGLEVTELKLASKINIQARYKQL